MNLENLNFGGLEIHALGLDYMPYIQYRNCNALGLCENIKGFGFDIMKDISQIFNFTTMHHTELTGKWGEVPNKRKNGTL